MGQVTFTITAPGINQTETFEVSDDGIRRMVEWAREAYPTEPTEANPNPAKPTIAEGFRRAMTGVLNGLKNNTISHERVKARQAVVEPTAF